MTLAERLRSRRPYIGLNSRLIDVLLDHIPERLEQRLFDRFFDIRAFHWSRLQWPLRDAFDRTP